MRSILIVAGKEFLDGVRNRWILSIAATLALMAIGLAYFGAAASGFVGFTSVSTTIASLSSLAVVVIPLIALLLSYDALVGEAENGTLLLLLTYPLTRTQLLLGKWMGQGGILVVATVIGFGSAALIMGLFAAEASWSEVIPAFAILILSACLLGWVFISMAYVLSARVAEKTKAAGMALLMWFLFVLVFDLGLLGILVATEGRINEDIFPWLLLLNPTDVFRLLNLRFLSDGEVVNGLMATAGGAGFSTFFLIMVLVTWLGALTAAAVWLFKGRSI
ncbi:ABC transporter permease [Aestuariirhabdus sp. Z084]|uniref:ABC transporter permease n=1 Tax=Aestuariirhabdus haliotis TaxID=2918751 RepID=UPI00201B422C|nr:ABC transporter permease subunit [Aestuariirhabdus haliotis]MCL6416659.1 ABC transporter permease [Aestuariirhabdus haliotis]MCL6421093.1 ABC transporter permease [Aestuariirhabdus haliotis]